MFTIVLRILLNEMTNEDVADFQKISHKQVIIYSP